MGKTLKLIQKNKQAASDSMANCVSGSLIWDLSKTLYSCWEEVESALKEEYENHDRGHKESHKPICDDNSFASSITDDLWPGREC